MPSSVTLAHISDVHLPPAVSPRLSELNVKRGLGLLNWQRSRRHVHRRAVADLVAADAVAAVPDHIAVTGDLANIGLPSEYATALGYLENLGPPSRVSVVPGNHDIYTTRHSGHSCLETWRPYMTSDDFGSRILGTGHHGLFPFVRRSGPVALVGLSSAIPTPPFVAAGEVGEAQLACLANILDLTAAAGLVRVILIHHPPLAGQAPPRRALRDAERLEQILLRHGAELVLHGHNHVDTLAWRSARHAAFPVIGVASGSAARTHGAEPPARYNHFRITPAGDAVHIDWTVRGFDPGLGRIVEISRKQLTTGGPRDDRPRRASAGADVPP